MLASTMLAVTKQEDKCNYYKLTIDDIQYCDVTKWYTEFKDVTVPTLTFAIGPEMLKYLTEKSSEALGNLGSSHEDWCVDGRHLEQLTSYAIADEDDEDEHYMNIDDIEVSEDDQEMCDAEEEYKPPTGIIADALLNITFHLSDLGGSVLPKLNWVAPKDAARLGFKHGLKCQSSCEIFMLFRMSERIAVFVNKGLKRYISNIPDPSPLQFHLVLRKWIEDLSSDMEFRCFVCDKRLTAICQRDTDVGYYAVFEQRDSIIKDIHEFFCDNIHGHVFDVARLSQGEVILLDFGVFGLPTNPLLFTYRELKVFMDEIGSNLESKSPSANSTSGLRDVITYGEPYFRYLTPYRGIRPITTNIMSAPDFATYLRERAPDD